MTHLILFVITGVWLILAAKFPHRLVWVLLLWLPIQGWLQLNVFNDSSLTVLLYEFQMIGLFAVFGIRAARNPQVFGIPPILWFAVPFTAWALLLVPSSMAQLGPITTLIGLRTYLLPFPLVWIGYRAFETRRQLQGLAWVLMLQLPIIGAVTASQLVTYTASSGAVAAMPTGFLISHVLRPPGTFSAPGHLGNYLLFSIPFAIGLIGLRTTIWQRLGFVVGLASAIVALLANTQRLTMVLLVIVVPLMPVMARRVRSVAGIALAAGVLLLALAMGNQVLSTTFRERVGSIQEDFYRTVVTTPAQHMRDALRHPLFGEGLGIASPGAARVATPLGTQNTRPLESERPGEAFAAALVYQTGAPGLMLFGVFVAALLGAGWRAVRACRHSDLVLLAAAILGFEVATCLASWSYSPLHYPPSRVLFWFWGGVLLSLPRLAAATSVPEMTTAPRRGPITVGPRPVRAPFPPAARRPATMSPIPAAGIRNRRG